MLIGGIIRTNNIMNEMSSSFLKILKNPRLVFRGVGYMFLNLFARQMSDKAYLQCKWWVNSGKILDLENPITFNEKLQWLKLYNRIPLYTRMVDKYEAKKYVASIIGEQYIIPTLAVYDSVEDIDFDSLPNQFVLKCTHDSGGIVICQNKTQLDRNEAKKKLQKGLKTNFYWVNREWPYKNVTPRIIAEKYLTNGNGELRDYKFFCFNGVPRVMFIASDRFNKEVETKFDFFDMDFNHLPFRNGHPNAIKPIERPSNFEDMKLLASKLSKDIPHVRVDFYNIDGQIYFGEMTFFHWSGFVKFEPEEWDFKMGEMIKLPGKY